MIQSKTMGRVHRVSLCGFFFSPRWNKDRISGYLGFRAKTGMYGKLYRVWVRRIDLTQKCEVSRQDPKAGEGKYV